MDKSLSWRTNAGLRGIDLVEYLFFDPGFAPRTQRLPETLLRFNRLRGQMELFSPVTTVLIRRNPITPVFAVGTQGFSYQLIVTVNVVEATVLPAVALNFLITWLLCVALGVV